MTGKAKRWQLDGKGTECFGTLLEKVEYNRQHEYLIESRESEGVTYIAQLEKETKSEAEVDILYPNIKGREIGLFCMPGRYLIWTEN